MANGFISGNLWEPKCQNSLSYVFKARTWLASSRLNTVFIQGVAAPQRKHSLALACDFALLSPTVNWGLNEVNAAIVCQTSREAGTLPRNTRITKNRKACPEDANHVPKHAKKINDGLAGNFKRTFCDVAHVRWL